MQAVLFAALVAAVVVAFAGLIPGTGERLREASPGWIALEIVLEIAACAAYGVLFQRVFSHGAHRLRARRGAQIGIAELGAFVIVPTGAGGPAVRIWALERSGMPFRVVMSRSVIHGAVFNLPYVLAAILLGAGAALGVGSGHAPVPVALAPLGLVAATVGIAGAATVGARRLPRAPRSRWSRIGSDIIRAVPDGLRKLPARLREPGLSLGAFAYWAGDCGVFIAAFHAAHGAPPIAVAVLAYMLGQLGNALPLPGGVGGVEPITLGVLTASGVNLELGAAAVILYRLVSLGIQTAAGAIALATLIRALRSPDPDAAVEPQAAT
ncbi:MAG TPA: lysylphosphatidylglycerol synthase transmembrane domain-containing protein [Solirubrobacteraceae bacterium]|nr:lysylphosphatidylglycerol synthase transmembrane domain-containing protein [Solirubrobacteraceae bacterium]